MTSQFKIILLSIALGSCGFPEDRKDNPDNAPVKHTGNATEPFNIDSPGSSKLTGADSARMVYNDDSSTSGTPSGRGTAETGKAVGTGTSRVGENHHTQNHPNDSLNRK